MNRTLFASLAVLGLLAAAPAVAKEGHKMDNHKMEASKSEANQPLKTVQCDSPCDFKVSSRDEKELVNVVKAHAKKQHHMNLTDAQVKEKIKSEPAATK